ncbi:hypothetical protein C8R44DRAFT_749841 [Mycena epipterygia]|nr:hypothetical protein C8R44DRAFT_749841 [Mycena epipterygia]
MFMATPGAPEYAEGAGGIVALATLVLEQIAVGHRMCSLPGLRSALRFVEIVEPSADGPLHSSLHDQGLVSLLAEIMCALPEVYTKTYMADTWSYLWIPQAIRAGVISAITLCATCVTSDSDIKYLKALLNKLIKSTVYYSVLRDLQDVLAGAEALMDARL